MLFNSLVSDYNAMANRNNSISSTTTINNNETTYTDVSIKKSVEKNISVPF